MSKISFLLFALVIIINLIFNAQFQLHYDESYYWVWGQNLELSYYDHPPMIAYLVGISSYFGHGEFWVRLPALITSAIAIIFVYKLAKRMFNDRVANIALMLAIACPIYGAMFFLLTPDSPLLMFWVITLYYFYIATFEGKRYAFYIAGVCAGLALLSKYTAILIYPGLFLFLITSKKYRHILLKPDIYIAFLLSWVVFLPVIIWNYQHEWVSFLFQFDHGMKSQQQFDILSFFDYLGGQLLVSGPISFIAGGYFIIRYFKINITN